MATLWIRQYTSIPLVDAGTVGQMDTPQVASEPGTDLTPLTFTTSTQSAAFATGTKFIAIIGSAAFHYVVGTNPTATTNALKVPADSIMFIGVTQGHKIAAITAV